MYAYVAFYGSCPPNRGKASALQRFARYEDEPEKLRAWICTPLTVGIFDRKAGTIAALFSTNLWTTDGLATEAGDTVFWDRSTLYALRGVFAAGETETALNYLRAYSTRVARRARALCGRGVS